MFIRCLNKSPPLSYLKEKKTLMSEIIVGIDFYHLKKMVFEGNLRVMRIRG